MIDHKPTESENQMLTEQGIVVDTKDGTAWVQTQTKTSCNSCKVNSSCGTGIISKAFGERSFITPMKNSLKAQAKDQVEVGIPDDLVVKSSLLVYMLPLSSMLIALIGMRIVVPDFSEQWQILAALAGLLLGFFAVKRISEKISKNNQLEPVLLRIVSRPIDVKQLETS